MTVNKKWLMLSLINLGKIEWNCNTNSEQLSKEKYNLLPHDVVTLDVDHDI